jgi:outer membrane lipase/esterase
MINKKICSFYLSIALTFFSNTCSFAQSFSNSITIGDSNSDSGRFHYLLNPTTAGSVNTPGAYTTYPGLMWSQSLGLKFGLTVTPSSAPGGGNNYAAGGATVNTANGGTGDVTFSNEWSATAQVAAYLASTGGKADPNSLYTVYIGNNDLHSWFNLAGGLPDLVDATVAGGAPNPLSLIQRQTRLIALGNQTASLVQQLSAAGARYILVPNSITLNTQAAADAVNYTGTTGVAWNVGVANAVQLYNSSMWNGIAAYGVNFIPADFNGVANYVILNAGQFGITNTDWSKPVCGAVLSINCSSANWVAGRTPNNSLFADYNGHLATVGQNIESDYAYGLLIAPGQVSMIANQAALNQIAMNNYYLDQVGYSFRAHAPHTLGAWALGGAQQVNVAGSPTNTSSNSNSGTAGMDYQYDENILLGAFVGYGQAQVNYNAGGNFSQSGTTAGAYVGYKNRAFWVNGMLAYNWLNNNIIRVTPIGITSFSNASNVNGLNTSFAVQTGYSFDYSFVKHGPVIGYEYINTNINGFTESGNFNSLQFGSQTINSSVGSAGYQALAKVGDWQFSTKAIYSSFLSNIDRAITTSLTSISAPSYTMPAMTYDKNWTNLTAGIGYQIDPKTAIWASFTQKMSQQSVNAYSAVVSLSSHF